MPVYGMRPEDVVVDAAGNVQTGATLTLHASQADAQAGSSALATVTTSAGRWSADVAQSPVWVRTPNGAVYQITDFTAKADKAYVDTQLSGKLDQATANSSFVPQWKPSTAYAAGQAVVNPSGDVVTAKAAHTSGTSFTAANWNLSPTYETKTVVAGKLAKGDLLVNVLDWGVTGDGTTDDTTALVNAAAEAASKKRTLWIPPGLTGVKITATVDLRFLNLQFDSTVLVTHTNAIGLRVGGSSTSTARIRIDMADVHNAAASPTFPSVRVSGLKNGEVRVSNCDYLQLFADGNVTDSTSIAYSKFWLGRKITKLELFGQNGVGWINENTFYGGSIDTLIVGGSYGHNSNLWLKPSIEGGSASVTFNTGASNRIEGMRSEATPSVTFAAGTNSNVVTTAFNTVQASFAANLNVTDNGVNNLVQGPLGASYRPVEIARIDGGSRIFNGCAEFPTASPPIPGLRSLKLRATFTDVIDTGLIPLDRSTTGTLAAEGLSRLRRFTIASSHSMWRPAVEVYDANRTRLDTSVATYIDTTGGWANQGGTQYGFGTTVQQARVLVTDSSVKFIRIRLQSSTGNAVFDWVSITAYLKGDDVPAAPEAVRAAMRRPLIQAAAPTQGAAWAGEVIASTAGGRHTCVARTDTTLSAAAAAAATTVTLTSVTGINDTDVIGVLLDDGTTHWAKVSGAPAGSVVTLSAALPSGAASGNAVVTNRWVTV